jgi:endonuclease/exonuclease/phosphatase family metal-dependent hydrolase
MIKHILFITGSIFILNASLMAQIKAVVMTYNIRLNVKSDAENWWEYRKDKVAALMNYYEADFIGTQEVQHEQLEYLLKTLPHYSSIGVGRDDGKTAGEYSCIFYNNKKYKPVQQSTFWLSQTPEKVSMGWNAVCNRVCTYGLFEQIKTRKKVWVFNTHFDHIGDTARIESAKLIIQRIKQVTSLQNYPVIFTGDFNSQPSDAPVQLISGYLNNARMKSETKPYGPADTWNGFKFNESPKGWIDYLFVSGSVNVMKYAVITDSYDRKYPSDHFPVLIHVAY